MFSKDIGIDLGTVNILIYVNIDIIVQCQRTSDSNDNGGFLQ